MHLLVQLFSAIGVSYRAREWLGPARHLTAASILALTDHDAPQTFKPGGSFAVLLSLKIKYDLASPRFQGEERRGASLDASVNIGPSFSGRVFQVDYEYAVLPDTVYLPGLEFAARNE